MRITSVTFGLATAVALTGCLQSPLVEHASPAGPPPLRAWIGFPVGSGRVFPIFVNREAHVAMFEIIPGRGVTMVYPTLRGHLAASEAHYADLSIQLGRTYYYSDPFGHSAHQPRYYYLVASVAPLNLTRLRSSLGATRKVLGRMYASYRPYDVIDRLTELVVPMQADEEWATDLFVHWPSPPPAPVFASNRVITCANGRVFVVPRNYPYFGCPGDPATEVKGDSPKFPVDSVGGDSLRRRPPEARPARPRPEVSTVGEVAERRRAHAGARPPREGARDVTSARSRMPHGQADSDGRRVSTSRTPSRAADNSASPASTTRDAPARETSTTRGAEPSTPRSEPRAPPRTESTGTTRKDP